MKKKKPFQKKGEAKERFVPGDNQEGRKLLKEDGSYSVRDNPHKGYRTNKRDWPKFLLHGPSVQYTGITKKQLKKMLPRVEGAKAVV